MPARRERMVFGRYGEVVNAFIARKVSRRGRRFGFVRFTNRDDAVVASKRLNGFFLYGFRISISFAKFNGRSSYWKKVRQRLPQENEENNDMSKTKQRRSCSVSSIIDRLIKWGLEEIKVHRMGANKSYLAGGSWDAITFLESD
ncbi:hypothetical protein V6N13_029143 [Hibiscus sabdariffa]